MNNRCVGINFRDKQCQRFSDNICSICGNPVCHFHGEFNKHTCAKKYLKKQNL